MNAPVLYPRCFRTSATVTAVGGRTCPLSMIPFANGSVDVNIDTCEGRVSGICALACVNRVPPLARLSMFGVARPRDPKLLTWSARSVSTEMRMMGGGVAAAAEYDRTAVAAARRNNRMPSEYRCLPMHLKRELDIASRERAGDLPQQRSVRQGVVRNSEVRVIKSIEELGAEFQPEPLLQLKIL